MRIPAGVIIAVVMVGGGLWAAEVPQDEIRAVVAQSAEAIIATQRDDGAFVLSEKYNEMINGAWKPTQYPVGETALGVMALQYALPHLRGDLRAKAYDAIRKGLGFILQQKPEEHTYSAALAICAMFQDNPERYQKMLGSYARMLCISQQEKGYVLGEWGYRLRPLPGPQDFQTGAPDNWGDKSNTQFALLGLYFADRAGFQVPTIIWARSADHYRRSQFPDGGWGYKPEERPDPYANMTIASTISLNLCEEMLRSKEHKQCVPPPRSKEIEAGLKWIADNWGSKKIGSDTYGLYALERLGIIMGRANIGGHDWYNEGARVLLGSRSWSSFMGSSHVSTAFGLMFLARGLEPIIINKLERAGTDDWNNDPYDVKHLTEHIQDRYQLNVQWRIVTLEAPLDLLLRTPMLYISGHKPLEFTPEEKAKLKAYVAGGGTIVGQACCAKGEFDKSFRALMKELFGCDLLPIPTTHRIYERMKSAGAGTKPRVEIGALQEAQGRPVVIYLPHDLCCRWHMGGTGAGAADAVGAGIYFYVTIELKKAFEEARLEKAEGKPEDKAADKPADKSADPFGPAQ